MQLSNYLAQVDQNETSFAQIQADEDIATIADYLMQLDNEAIHYIANTVRGDPRTTPANAPRVVQKSLK